MKKAMFIVLFLSVLAFPLHAQKKNSLRIGASADFTTGYHTVGRWTGSGPGIYMEYGRAINRFLSVSAGLNVGGFSTKASAYSRHNVTLSAYCGVRPFVSVGWLGWLELGAGITGSYIFDIYDEAAYMDYEGETVRYYVTAQQKYVRPGLDIWAKAYVIDNERFDLAVFVNMETAMTIDWDYRWGFLDCGVMFGVKF